MDGANSNLTESFLFDNVRVAVNPGATMDFDPVF